MRKYGFPLIILVLIGLDQWIKYWVVDTIALGETRSFLPGFMSLTYLQNDGAAFSILQGQLWFFYIITVVVIGAAIWYYIRHIKDSLLLLLSLSLVIAGGLGNFIDRVRLGYVVDMFQTEFMDFAIFNFADACLSVGVVLLFICLWKEESNGNKD